MSDFINRRLFNGNIENQFILDFFDAIVTLLVLYILSKLIIKIIEKLLKSSLIHGKMLSTSFQLLKNVVHVIFFAMGLFTILEILGVNTASLIATAGIGGVAVGFGAQSLVKDVISGFFILIEGQYYIGDEVVIEDISGDVVDFSLRTTEIKDAKM